MRGLAARIGLWIVNGGRDTDAVAVLRTTLTTRVSTYAFIAIFALTWAFVGGLVISGSPTQGDPLWQIAIGHAVVGCLAVRAARLRLVVHRGDLAIHNYFRTITVKRSDFDRAEVNARGGSLGSHELAIYTTDGRRIRVDAVRGASRHRRELQHLGLHLLEQWSSAE